MYILYLLILRIRHGEEQMNNKPASCETKMEEGWPNTEVPNGKATAESESMAELYKKNLMLIMSRSSSHHLIFSSPESNIHFFFF